MSKIITIISFFFTIGFFAQETPEFKKRVLEKTEIDLLMSYYAQDGANSSVGGGIGTEELTDITPTLVVTIPLNADDVLTLDAGLSAYTSASSSNINPFSSGASTDFDDDDDDDDDKKKNPNSTTGTPWLASSGASKKDVLKSVLLSYAHSNDSRNGIWNAHASFSTEYDYTSLGFGGGYTKLFNQKNTEIGLKANVYLDQWRPIYPTELKTFEEVNGDLNAGFFQKTDIWSAGSNTYNPNKFSSISDKGRNSYSVSFSFSQILSKKLQTSLFFDIVKQEGLLSTPYHRIYFKDAEKFYIGNSDSIFDPNQAYDDSSNTDFFMLADDIERMPNNRLKLPVGVRLHYYINEFLTLRNYYRFYWDDWGVLAHTYSIEMPIKLGKGFTAYPSYRFYTQNQADYFAPFNEHLSTETYYTSDYDLSTFSSNQFGLGIKYADILTKRKLWKFGFKSVNLNYNHYERTTGLNADIISLGFQIVMDSF
ncbi:MAG TPA: DUF3570 domain-containing protein [Lutibacter sp.]|nr:DUF3570 domain-containing protein [Lutibacter sp.]